MKRGQSCAVIEEREGARASQVSRFWFRVAADSMNSGCVPVAGDQGREISGDKVHERIEGIGIGIRVRFMRPPRIV